MKEITKKKLAIAGGILVAGSILATSIFIIRRAFWTIPKGVHPVRPFDLRKYMGKWYEIARTENRFERNLKNITLEFSLNRDRTIDVIHRSFDMTKQKPQTERGVAAPVDEKNVGKLRISYWRPLYSGYNVIEIDPDYQYALVVGDDLKQMWLFSRKPDMLDEIADQYLAIARSYGYDTSNLIWIEQDDY